MSKHTPGPWTLERVPIKSTGGSNTAYKIGPMQSCLYDDWRARDTGISEEENKANATLMAAAPDLLAACEFAVTPDHPIGSDPEYLRKIRDKAVAAIAKAKGGAA